MRKKIWRYVRFIIVVLVLGINFTACSNKKEEKDQAESTQNDVVYQSSFQNFPIAVDSISNICMKDNHLYMFGDKWEEDEKNKENGKQYIYFIHCGTDGSDVQKIEVKKLENHDYVNVMVCAFDEKQQFRFITQTYDFNEKTGEDKEAYYVHTINEQGKILDTIELKREQSKSTERFFYPNANNTVFANDKIYIAGDQRIYEFNQNGKEDHIYEIKDIAYIHSFVISKKGEAYLYGHSGEVYGFRKFDLKTGNVDSMIPFEDYTVYNPRAINAFDDNTFSVSDGNNLYTIDISSGKVTEELNWINSDINGDNVTNCFPLKDGNFFAITSSYDNSKQREVTEFITMKKVKASDIKEKKKLTFACDFISSNLKDQILSFNKTNKEYRIEVKSYAAYEDSAEKLKMDMASGSMPDILDMEIGISKDQMIKKGMFTDLYPFIEKDKEIKKNDFFPSILKVLETNGKLYCISPTFTITGLATGKKMSGSEEEWNIDDMITRYQEMPKDSMFIQGSSEWFLNVMANYIRSSGNEINFNSEEFIKLMEFSSNFSEEKENTNQGEKDIAALINKKKLLFFDFNLSSVVDLGMYTSLYKKQHGYTVLGYPLKEKSNQLSVDFYSALAISEQCKEKEGAWSFLRQMLTYEYQKKTDYDSDIGIPIRKDALAKQLEYAQATKSYIDEEDGTKVEPLHVTYGFDGYTVEIGPIHKKDAESIYNLIDRVNGCFSDDIMVKDILKIVQEESKTYDKGDKTAKEAADIIQNRVNIYISENS